MYEYITGEVTEITPAYAVIEAAGVGYYLIISLNTFSAIEKSKHAKLFTHYVVREDAQILYGFADKAERELFRLLIGVSGVGGNTARTILSTYSSEELSSIISTENSAMLSRVKGLGVKTSQKIIVELRDKMHLAAGLTKTGGNEGAFGEAVAALTMLGFAKTTSEKAVQNVLRENSALPVEEIIRAALKQL